MTTEGAWLSVSKSLAVGFCASTSTANVAQSRPFFSSQLEPVGQEQETEGVAVPGTVGFEERPREHVAQAAAECDHGSERHGEGHVYFVADFRVGGSSFRRGDR